MEYGVQTHNKFAFLDDDGDPEEALNKLKEEKKKAAPVVSQPKKVKTPAEFPKQGGGGRGPRDPNFHDGQRSQRSKMTVGNNDVNDSEEIQNKLKEEKTKAAAVVSQPKKVKTPNELRQVAGYRGPRDPNFRGGRRPQRSNVTAGNNTEERKTNDDKKKFDEKPVEAVKDDWSAATDDWTAPADDRKAPADDWKAPADDWSNATDGQQKINDENKVDNTKEEVKNEEVENEEEKPPKEKTYEEWKAELNQKNIETTNFNTRKPGEGDDQKIYQKLIPLKKEVSKKADETTEEAQHKERREKPVNFDVSFADKRSGFGSGRTGFGTERNGGGPTRGDRQQIGGGRGQNAPRGPPRNNNYGGAGTSRRPQNKQNQESEFMLKNEQFPALGASH